MFKLENMLLFILIIICALVSYTLVESVIGEGDIVGTVLAASDRITNENSIGSDNNLPNIIEFDEDAHVVDRNAEDLSAQMNADGWQVFRSEGYAFELSYPATILPKIIPDHKSLNAGLEVPEETPVWQFYLSDPALFEGTNLVDASFVVQVTRGEDALSACLRYKSGSIYQLSGEDLPLREINQVSFLKDVVQEGVMGGSYTRISFRAVSQNACYELSELIHSNNIENFPADAIQPFDEQAVSSQLDQILGTFKFLETEATFPEMVYPDAKTVSLVVNKAPGGYADGIDVSHWQGDVNWTQVGNAGIAFAFVKGTEGVGWTDSLFVENMTNGPDSGVVRGVYHFARPDLDNTGREEAEYFLSVAGDYLKSGYLRPVLDLEVRGSLGQTALSAWVLEWMQTVENQSGVAPLIYTNLNYVNNYLTNAVTDNDLWIAYWTIGCDPTVTYTIPPTGKWSDWAFWQYCVAPAGTVPGITTPIDLDIFNGIEDGLTEYDAASPLWVSLTSDAYRSRKPYFADITADVNGDASGLITYHFWWNCNSLESDITSVEAACGVLPQPVTGECLKDGVGMRCNAVANEVQLAEYTYQEIGDFTAKVIVERGSAPPAEDRYQISVVNPLFSLSADPVSAGVGTPYEDFEVSVDVIVKPTINGVVQVDIIENGSLTPLDSACQAVVGDVQAIKTFDMTIPWSTGETVTYMIWARYRSSVLCPVTNTNPDDLSLSYEIDWNQPTFSDVPFNHPLHGYIQALWNAGFTAGCSTDPLLFCPDTVMDRAQSAVFMLRGQFGTGYVPPPEPWDTFTDDWSLSDISWSEKWAEGMWEEDLSDGCLADPLMYCPRRELPRVEASVFGLRMKHGIDYVPPDASGSLFADMTDVNYWGTKWAEQAFLDGLLPECGTQDGKPLFCPDDLLDRGWGAYLIVISKDLPLL